MRSEQALNAEQREVLERIGQDATVAQVYDLSRHFVHIVRERAVEQLDDWLEASKASGIMVLQHFAFSLAQDYDAVRAALETAWSNGQREGQITRLKFIKRQMYGRAKFDLLRQRVLYAA